MFKFLFKLVTALSNSIDSSTYANLDEVVPLHISLDFAVDFERQVFDGKVTHTFQTIKEDLSNVYLDAVGLDISQVDFKKLDEGEEMWTFSTFEVATPNDKLG